MMKKIIISAIIFCIAANAVYAKTYQVLSRKLTIRESPDIEAPAVYTLPNGEIFEADGSTIVENGDKWMKAAYKEKTGYVRTEVNGGQPSIQPLAAQSTSDKVVDKVLDSINAVTQKKTAQAKESPKNEPETSANMVFIEGEGLHRVAISLKDLNRITCPGKIGDPVYSRDKQFEVVRGGDKDLFVKISPVQTVANGITETTFGRFPRELFVECSGRVYSLSLIPDEKLTSQTVVMKVPLEDITVARDFERAKDYEAFIADLIRHAYAEQLPDGYTVSAGNMAYQFKEIDMRLRYSYKGADYIVEDWEIKSKLKETVEIEENVFVQVLKDPRAIALTNPRLAYGETSRLLVVRNTSEQ